MSKFWKMVDEKTKRSANDFIRRMKSNRIMWVRRRRGYVATDRGD